MNPKVSIVIPTYNRPESLRNTLMSISRQQFKDYEIIVVDDGDDKYTEHLCKNVYPQEMHYFKIHRLHDSIFNNPARVFNVGIRKAVGDILLFQTVDCMHGYGDGVIDKLTSQVTATNAVFAKVIELNRLGYEDRVYVGKANPRPIFMCGAMKRKHFVDLRGFDEDYLGYGYEDDDFAYRLRRLGINFVYTDTVTYHQWHESNSNIDMTPQRELFEKKRATEGIVRNLNKDWGML